MRVLIVLPFLLFCVPFLAAAQLSDDLYGKQLSISLSPQYPNPGEVVTVSLDDYSLGVTNQSVRWTLNGRSLDVAADSRNFTFTPTEPLKPYSIGVILTTATNQRLTANTTVTPRYLDIIVEPQTYVPAWYTGRAEPTVGSLNRVTALLHTNNGPVDSNQFTYIWKVNNTVINGGGQHGGYQTVYTTPIGSSHLLTVEVLDNSGTLISKRTTTIVTSEVRTVLYEVSPLYGVHTTPIGPTLPMISNSLTLTAIPFNLDVRGFSQNLFTQCQINNQTIAAGKDPFTITLGRQGTGQSEVSFKLRNQDALLQGDDVITRLQF